MQTTLVWTIYGLIPRFPLFTHTVLNAIAMVLWMALLTYLSVLWRDRIDASCAVFTQWIEDIMLGKRQLLGDISISREKVRSNLESVLGKVELGTLKVTK
jgi:hypothetical protein